MDEFCLTPRAQPHDRNSKFECCLPNISEILPSLTTIIDAPYSEGEFEHALIEFSSGSSENSLWSITGSTGVKVDVILEKKQSHLIIRIYGQKTAFTEARELLLNRFMACTGSTSAAEELLLSYGS